MSNFLANLAARSLNLAQEIQPRPLALFEPGPVGAGPVAPVDRSAEGLGKRGPGDAPAEEPAWSGPAWGERLVPETVEAASAAPVAALAPSVDVAPQGPTTPVSLEAMALAVTLHPRATVPLLARRQAHTQQDGAAAVEPEPPSVALPVSETPGIPLTVRPAPAVAEVDARPSLRALAAAGAEVAGAILPPPVETTAERRGAPLSPAPPGSEQKPIPGNQPARMQVVLAPALGAPPEVPPVGNWPSRSPDVASLEPPAREGQTIMPAWQPPPGSEGQLIARPTVTQPQPPGPAFSPERRGAPREPVVQVSIGRIEVHVAAPPKPRREPPARLPTLGLTEYLQQYGGKR